MKKIFVFIFLILFCSICNADSIKSQFARNGEHKNLTLFIKSIMNDPSSFEFVSCSYTMHTNYLTVYENFRERNIFNAKILNRIKANIDLTGHIINIEFIDYSNRSLPEFRSNSKLLEEIMNDKLKELQDIPIKN